MPVHVIYLLQKEGTLNYDSMLISTINFHYETSKVFYKSELDISSCSVSTAYIKDIKKRTPWKNIIQLQLPLYDKGNENKFN